MSLRTTSLALVVASSCSVACGTYSALRPADNLRRGEVDVAAGLAANQIGEVLPVVRATVGVTDRIEIGAQYEVYSALASARLALLRSDEHGIAVSAGVEGGYVSVLDALDGDDYDLGIQGEALGGVLAVGRRWRSLEIYAVTKALAAGWGQGSTSFLGVYRAGLRIALGDHFYLGAEGGGTLHHSVFVGEGTGFASIVF